MMFVDHYNHLQVGFYVSSWGEAMTESGEDHEKCLGKLCVGFHGDGRVAFMGFSCDCLQEYSPLIPSGNLT
jgi:hypothetical protein